MTTEETKRRCHAEGKTKASWLKTWRLLRAALRRALKTLRNRKSLKTILFNFNAFFFTRIRRHPNHPHNLTSNDTQRRKHLFRFSSKWKLSGELILFSRYNKLFTVLKYSNCRADDVYSELRFSLSIFTHPSAPSSHESSFIGFTQWQSSVEWNIFCDGKYIHRNWIAGELAFVILIKIVESFIRSKERHGS